MSQNTIKGNIPEHFEMFRTPLSQLHNYNTRNGYLLVVDFPCQEQNGEDELLVLKLLTIGQPYLLHLRDQYRTWFLKEFWKGFLKIIFSFMYTFLMEFLLLPVYFWNIPFYGF